MKKTHRFADEPIRQLADSGQLSIEGLENVVPIETGRAVGETAMIGSLAVEVPDDDPYGSLGGGVRVNQEKVKEERAPLIASLKEKNGNLQQRTGKRVMSSPSGMSFSWGIDVIRMLGESSAGNPYIDVPTFITQYRRPPNRQPTERERAVKVLQVEGLETIKLALAIYKNSNNLHEASKAALEEIGGNAANLHTDTEPGGAVELFEGLLQSTYSLLQTFGVYRREGKRNILKQDPVLIIRDIQNALAKSGGYTIPEKSPHYKPWEKKEASDDLKRRRRGNIVAAASVLSPISGSDGPAA